MKVYLDLEANEVPIVVHNAEQVVHSGYLPQTVMSVTVEGTYHYDLCHRDLKTTCLMILFIWTGLVLIILGFMALSGFKLSRI
jgi:hypothetical protein